MKLAFTDQTVMFSAGRTFVVGQGLIKGKNSTTTRSGAPASVVHVILYVVLEGKLIISLSQLCRKVLSDFLLQKLGLAILERTRDRDQLIGYFLLTVSIEAFSMAHVATAEVTKFKRIDFSGTDGTLDS